MPDFAPLLLPLAPLAGRRVVVGVSGGADSVSLLRALLLAGAEPVVAHLDHALREGSAEDAVWVGELAARLGVPFQSVRVDVGAVADRRGWNVEDAARRIRYDFLGRVAKQSGAEFILTAHTRRDQAETVLTRLLRGEAVLSGILAGQGRLRRPWLDVSRADLEQFLHALGQDWREDPTNADPHYNRAWLRGEVMPLLAARYPAVEVSLSRVACLQSQDDAALTALAAGLTAHTPLPAQPPAVLRRWLALQLEGAGLTYHAEHLQALAEALQAGQTLHLTLPGAREVTVTGGQLFTAPREYPPPTFTCPPHWTLRTRQPGDRITLPGGTRKLSDVLTDLHIPRAERDRVPLLADRNAVMWLGVQPELWALGAREQVPDHRPDPLDAAMAEALVLARQSAAAQEVPVGAVVLNAAGQIVGRGRNTSRQHADMTRHAELAALREAARQVGPYLGDCTLVVTLEPCPMCLGAALEARIGRIVYGASNPKAGALGGVHDLLRHHWGHVPEVVGGVRAGEAGRLLREVFREVRAEGGRRKAEGRRQKAEG